MYVFEDLHGLELFVGAAEDDHVFAVVAGHHHAALLVAAHGDEVLVEVDAVLGVHVFEGVVDFVDREEGLALLLLVLAHVLAVPGDHDELVVDGDLEAVDLGVHDLVVFVGPGGVAVLLLQVVDVESGEVAVEADQVLFSAVDLDLAHVDAVRDDVRELDLLLFFEHDAREDALALVPVHLVGAQREGRVGAREAALVEADAVEDHLLFEVFVEADYLVRVAVVDPAAVLAVQRHAEHVVLWVTRGYSFR